MGNYTQRKRRMKWLFSSAQTHVFKLLNEGRKPEKRIPPSFSESHFSKYAAIDDAKRENVPGLTPMQISFVSRGKLQEPKELVRQWRMAREEPPGMPNLFLKLMAKEHICHLKKEIRNF